MRRTRLIFFLCFFSFVNFCIGQKENLVTIKGYAPAYVGKMVEVYEIQDYLSNTEVLLGSAIVEGDSTFNLQFKGNRIQKVVVRSNKNSSFLYIQPNAIYEVYLPEKDKYDPYRPNGNSVELSFYGLDSTDINYKILGFERWVDDFLGTYFYIKKVDGIQFALQLEKFKKNVEKAYATDTSTFFKTFVKFSFASLDEIQQSEAKGLDQKYDFYIKYAPVSYENDAYMEYISDFYKNFMVRLSFKVYNDVYLGILKSSPTLIMKALSGEYYLMNLRLREMMMVNMLSDVFYTGDIPQANILTIMDSVSNHAMFEANKVVSKNLRNRLLELVPGGRAPDFMFTTTDGSIKTLGSYANKHIYLHFFDPSSVENIKELQLLIPLQLKYKNDIQFITIYLKKESYSEEEKKNLSTVTWDNFQVSAVDPVLKKYKIETFPSYVLLDGYGYVVASPALGPIPNGQGVTIDKMFFYIEKMKSELKKTEK